MARSGVTAINLNSHNISRQILKAPGTRADIERRTRAVARAAGEGYEPSVVEGRNRVRGSVITATYDARRDNGKNHTLLRALDAARR
jgi:hypothetical protein